MTPTWKGSKLTSNIQRFKVDVQRFKVNVQRFKVTHAAWVQILSMSVHFHHVIGVSINYHRVENSMNVEILNQTIVSTNSSSSCFNSNSSSVILGACVGCEDRFFFWYKSTYVVYVADTDISRSDLSLPWTGPCRFPSVPTSSGLHHWGNKSSMGN